MITEAGTGASSNATVPAPLTELVTIPLCGWQPVTRLYALTDDGKIFTWGRNDAGQLGHGDATSISIAWRTTRQVIMRSCAKKL